MIAPTTSEVNPVDPLHGKGQKVIEQSGAVRKSMESSACIGDSVRDRTTSGYEKWPPIGWHDPFVIDWSKYRLELATTTLYYGLMWPVWIPTVFQIPGALPLYSPDGRGMPAIRAVQVDCERG